MMNIKFLMYVAALLLTASIASAWSGYTHQWICDKAGLSQYNCSIADDPTYQKKVQVTNNGHLCLNNSDDCRARTLAGKFFFTNPELSLHLWADSMTPVHWQNYGFAGCHAAFEDCVDSNLKFGNTNWECSLECADLSTRQKHKNYADYPYMLSAVDYVKGKYQEAKNRELAYKIALAAISIFTVLFATVYRRKT